MKESKEKELDFEIDKLTNSIENAISVRCIESKGRDFRFNYSKNILF